jgi:hypothetical protein
MTRLHVANGHSTTALIRRAGIEGDLSVWADPLHEGPVPGGISDRALREVRAGYLAETQSGEAYEEILASLTASDSALERADRDDEIVLWYEHDLFDQLNLIQLLARLHGRSSVNLICIGTFPGRPAFKGLGELLPGELASLWESRQRVVDAQYALAHRAWEAFRAAIPAPLVCLLAEDLSALPFLGPALRRHLEEFPWIEHGLSRTEARMLEIASGSPVEIWEAFKSLHENETCFYVADLSFWRIARELAALGLAQIEVGADTSAGAPGASRPALPRGTIATTASGRRAVDGRIDRVRHCGIDRWLGGIHLIGEENVWRWDARAGRIARS